MFGTAAAIAYLWAMAFQSGPDQVPGPVTYEAAQAAQWGAGETAGSAQGSTDADAAGGANMDPMMSEEADWSARATLYHAGGGGATGNDSLGCRPIPMRTVAVDPNVIPRRTKLFIRETVGMRMPDGSIHDGYWYASDTGGAVRGQHVDLYTGNGRGSMQPAMRLNTRRLTVVDAGRFQGCPPSWDRVPSRTTQLAMASTSVGSR